MRCGHGQFALVGLVAIRVVAGWIVTGDVVVMASAGLGDQAWPILHANFVKAAINRVLFFHGCADATIAAVLDVFDHLQPSAFMVPQCTAGADVGSQPLCSSPQYSGEMPTSRTDMAEAASYLDDSVASSRCSPSDSFPAVVRRRRKRTSIWSVGSRASLCRRFARTGTCIYGEACRFTHFPHREDIDDVVSRFL